MRLLFVLLFSVSLSFASSLYVLPQEAKKAEDRVLELIKGSQKSIHIAMYNFTHKKFAKALKKAASKGVNIHIILDKYKASKGKSQYKNLRKYTNVSLVSNPKMHMKVAVFDEKVMLLGSTNWKKESFEEDYEVLFETDKKSKINKFLEYFTKMIK